MYGYGLRNAEWGVRSAECGNAAASGGGVQLLPDRERVMTSLIYCPRPTAKFHLNIDDLIREVHYRPAIWNKRYSRYTDRRLKSRMWDEVCENIIHNWKKMKVTQQNAINVEVQKKWRNVKDAFNKEMKRIAAGQDVRKRQYCHFKALSFLSNSKVYDSKNAMSLDGSDVDSDNTSDHEDASTSSVGKRTLKKNDDEDEDDNSVLVKREKLYSDEEKSSEHNMANTDNHDDNLLEIEVEKSDYLEDVKFTRKKVQNTDEFSDKHFVEIKCDGWDNEMNTQIISQSAHNIEADIKTFDEDISFTEMLVPMLRRLNGDQKHYAKIEILNILHKAKDYHPSVSCETQTEGDRPGGDTKD